MRGEADAAERRNRALLVEDLSTGRLRFRSRPVEAHVQFSTYCNQSCVMCWDGNHPPLADMDDQVLDRISEEIAPTMSVLIPHDGSEPTARRWHEICDFARQHGLELDLTTNLQAFTEARLEAALDVIGQLHLSVDSHLPEVLEQMRPGVRPAAVLRHLATTVRAARAADIDCDVNVVFSTLNALTLPETVATFAELGVEAICLLRLMDVNTRSARLDPLSVWSAGDVRRSLDAIEAAARRHGMNLWNQIDDTLVFAGPSIRHRTQRAGRIAAHRRAEAADERAALLRPGYCRFVHSGLRVTVEGEVTPCGYGTPGELSLGNLRSSTFEDIWNGRTAQDLRRAMLTRDLPTVCTECPHSRPPAPTHDLPMWGAVPPPADPGAPWPGPRIDGPAHGHRSTQAPSFVVRQPLATIDGLMLHAAPAGGSDVVHVELVRRRRRGLRREFELPVEVWERLPVNTGVWWVLSAVHHGRRTRIGDRAKVIVRNEPMPRIPGSRLRYSSDRCPEPTITLDLTEPHAVPVAIR